MTDLMQADQIPDDFVVQCDICGKAPGKNAGPNWVKNHKKAAHNVDSGPADQTDQLPNTGSNLTTAEKKLLQELQATLAMPTMLLYTVNAIDAQLILNGTPDLLVALILCARKSAQLKSLLKFIAEGTAWLQLGAAIMSILLPILDNHHVVSVPTFRVEDRLNKSQPQQRPGTAPTGPVTADTGGAVPDMTSGMNRSQRRAVERTDLGSFMPQGAKALMDNLGVTEDDLKAAMASLTGEDGG